jgi:hypothetical protein
MQNSTIYPHAKVFADTDGKFHFLTATHKNKTGHKTYERMGDGLIDFITLDLCKYESELKRANSQMELAHVDMWNWIFDVAEMTKGKHEYVWFFLVGALNNIFESKLDSSTQISRCFAELYDVLELHKTFIFAVNLCLEVDNFSEFTTAEKYIFVLKSGFKIVPAYKDKMDFSVVEYINRKEITGTREILKAIQRDDRGVNLVPFTLIETLEEMLYFEFVELLKQGTSVKKCRLCKRYFILSSQHETYFCDRIHSGNRTCKQVGTKRDYNAKIADDSFLREYQRIYKRYFSRGEMPFKKDADSRFYSMSFREWSAIARKLRRRYVGGEISGEELVSGIRE